MKTKNLKFLAILLTALFSIANFNTGWAKPIDGKIKHIIDDFSTSLKKRINHLGDDLVAVQNYLDNYHWKGLIQDEATSEAATLKHLTLNGHSLAVAAKPGELIEGIVLCNLEGEKCYSLSLYRVVLGIYGQGAQTTIGNELGLVAGESLEKFTLIAPVESGIYEIRFRLVDSYFKSNALDAWKDANGDEPDGTTTIGIIIVK